MTKNKIIQNYLQLTRKRDVFGQKLPKFRIINILLIKMTFLAKNYEIQTNRQFTRKNTAFGLKLPKFTITKYLPLKMKFSAKNDLNLDLPKI